MKRLLGGFGAAALLGLLPFATGQEPGKDAPPAAAAQETKPGAPFFERFDLNKDGKVDWEEYQKVKSGFTGFDADGDGAITHADFAKLMERQRQRMQQEMQRRMMRRMQGGDGGRGMRRGGFGRGGSECPCCGGEHPGMGPRGPEGFGPPEGRQGWRGRGGPRGPREGMPRRGPPQGGGMGWGSGAPGAPEREGPPPR